MDQIIGFERNAQNEVVVTVGKDQIILDPAFVAKHKPQEGGWLVIVDGAAVGYFDSVPEDLAADFTETE